MSTLLVEKGNLHVPSLTNVSQVLQNGLVNNFDEVSVEVVMCPDLTQLPFTLASPGLSGKPRLIELGGTPYLLPKVQRSKLYELKDMVPLADMESALIIGAGAGPHPSIGSNCEGIYNLHIKGDTVKQLSRISRVVPENSKSVQELLPRNETRCALLANLFFSEGLSGEVLRIYVKKRTGTKDFATAIRTTLADHYKDQIVGLGGAFLIKEGRVHQHVMDDFIESINDEDELNRWLKFYNMSAPLVAVGTLSSGDVGELDLRIQHFHSFSHHNDAGHYHYDTTPDTVEYLGYFNVAEFVYRIDRPMETHKWGRD